MNRQRREEAIALRRYLKESRGLERGYITELLISRQRAYQGMALLVILILLALSITIIACSQTPPEPVILRVDNTTGAIDTLTTVKTSELSYGEVVDTYWLNQYVLNRESYDGNQIQLLYDTTALLSSPDVQQAYYALYAGPNSLDQRFKAHTRRVITVRAITPNPAQGTAVVRFSAQNKGSQGVDSAEHFIATLSYTYKQAPMKALDRRINPLGFQVTSYRVDPEVIPSKGENS